MTQDDARRIAQDFLDRQGEATVSGDIEETLAWCDLPCTLESMDSKAVATNMAEMRAICASFIEGLKVKQLTHMVRTCLTAEFSDPDTLVAQYRTRYLRDGKWLADDPYIGTVVLRRKPDRWKISAMKFAVSNDSPANATLRAWERGRGFRGDS